MLHNYIICQFSTGIIGGCLHYKFLFVAERFWCFILGTTCATVLTQAILMEGCKSLAAGANVMDLRNGINMAVDAVITDLKSRALMISTPEEITQVTFLFY